MKHLLLPSLFVLVFASCAERVIVGEGARGTDQRTLAPFSRVEVSAPLELRISTGDRQDVSLEGYSNLLKEVRTEIKGQTLRIFVGEGVDLESDKPLLAIIKVPTLTALDLSGDVKAGVGLLNTPDFALGMSGACDATFRQLQVGNFTADMSGSTNLRMESGAIATGNYEISGSGEINSFGVRHNRATLDISGSGDAELTVDQSLNVEVSGSASIRYKGHPAIRKSISGSGEVVAAE